MHPSAGGASNGSAECQTIDRKTLRYLRSFHLTGQQSEISTMKRSQVSVLSRASGGSGGSCVVCGRREATNALSEVRLFAFPLCQQRKSVWMRRCRLEASDISSRAKICNHHFESGYPVQSKNDVDYAPTLHLQDPPAIRDNHQCVQKQQVPKKAARKASAASSKASKRDNASDDDFMGEEDHHCFEEVCDNEHCQQQATKLVELLVKVGTLEQTISVLRHDLNDKDKEIAKFKARLKKVSTIRNSTKTLSQQSVCPKQRNESNVAKKTAALERTSRETRRSSLKLRIRTSRVRYVDSTSSDEFPHEHSNRTHNEGPLKVKKTDNIVHEVVLGLVKEACRRNSPVPI